MKASPLLLLLLAASLSLMVGARPVPPEVVWAALTAPDAADPAHLVVRDLRLPRLFAGLLAGAALAAAGVLMQAVTRNPIAEPGLLGVNAGASFGVVLGAYALGMTNPAALAFPGAAGAAVAVFLLGGGGGPVRLALAGAALTALLLSLVSALVLIRAEALEVYRFWIVGSLAGSETRPLALMALIAGAGALIGLAIAGALDALALGDEAARSLGTRTALTRALALLAVTALCGTAVVTAGPIAFLGLIVPHLARLAGARTVRAQLLLALPLGAAILVLADVAGRVILPPSEVRVGLMAALLGGPFFVIVVRRMRLGALA